MRALLLAASVFAAAGCLNGEYNPDMAAGPPDFAVSLMFDLTGVDLYGAYNCSQLNMCENKCTTKACVYMCRNMATPSAVAKELSLQACFAQYCPTGAGQVCAPDAMGMLSMACMTCINNTYVPANASCSPTQNPSECHLCLQEANACAADM